MNGEKNREGKRKHTFLRYLLTFSVAVLLVLTVAGTVTGLVFAIYVDKYIDKSVDETLFGIVGEGGAAKFYYYEFTDRENREGEAVEQTDETLYGGYRCDLKDYSEFPENLKNAFVSIEDKRFWSHSGVDWKRTLSAGLNYFLKFSDSYGGSTITQQLVKNVTGNDDYSFQRKIQEIFWALDLETKMDKTEILGLYLNIINLSDGCYGVGAAAEYYFSKDVSELTLNECACIAAITNSPYYYNPIRNPENNAKRRNMIIKEMFSQGYISEEEYNEAYGAEVVLRVAQKNTQQTVNSWYTDMVIEDVINALSEELGYSRQMASLMIYSGGLNIYTVMEPDIQNELEKCYSDRSAFYATSDGENPQSAMIIIDPATGDILGVAGAVGEKTANRIQNFATHTLRPAGSVIKPLSVYAPALEEGIITWSSIYDDVPVNFGNYNLDPDNGQIIQPVAWPRNSNGIYRGLTDINYAIEHSVNTVAVKVLEDLGLERSFEILYDKLQMKSLIRSKRLDDGRIISDMDVAALALGQFNYGVTVREITAAYSIFVNNGVYNTPRSYLKVTDKYGNILLRNDYKGEAVISESNACIMTLMLENVIKNGTASQITLDSTVDCAGKTGTTQNNCDRWFIGYTPYYICGAWYGYEYPKPLSSVPGNPCIGAWDRVMTAIHQKYIDSADAGGEELKTFGMPEDVIEAEYCLDSGMLVTDACLADARGERVAKGYFVKGTEPDRLCTCHRLVAYDSISGGVVITGCPDENIKNVGMINVERSFPMQIYVSDAQYVWRDIGKDIQPETSPSLPFFNNLLGDQSYCGISDTEIQFNRACREHFNYFEWKKKKDG